MEGSVYLGKKYFKFMNSVEIAFGLSQCELRACEV